MLLAAAEDGLQGLEGYGPAGELLGENASGGRGRGRHRRSNGKARSSEEEEG